MRRRSVRTRPARRPAVLAALVVVAAALSAAAGVATATAGILDNDAVPSHSFLVNGSANTDDFANDVAIGSGVSYLAGEAEYTGTGGDATLTRISHTAWTAVTTHYDSRYHGYDSALAIALGPRGTIYTAGASSRGANDDMLVIRWSKKGGVLWAQRYNGPANGSDRAVDIAVDRDGNVVVCGPSQGSTGYDWAVVSWTKKGARRWVWRYAGSGHFTDTPEALVLDGNGNAYVCGSVTVADPTRTAAGIAKVSRRGSRMWVRTYTGPLRTGAAFHDLAADPAGGVFACGYAENGATGRDALVARYSVKGRRSVFLPLRNMALDSGPDVLTDVTVTRSTKQVIGVGYRAAPSTASNPIVMRWQRDGAYRSGSQFPTTGDDRWTSICADPFGGYVMAGSYGSGNTDIHTRRESTYPSAAIWASRWSGPTPAFNNASAVAARGGLVATVGTQYSGAASGRDQVALFWVY